MTPAPDRPRSLASEAERTQRMAMLDLPHAAPLKRYVQELRGWNLGEIPHFDPMDGGVNARALFLFEKPGPKAAASGFISRNNNDPTAEATFNFMRQSSIPRDKVCIWNVVPGWNGTRKVTTDELRLGAGLIDRLLAMMPQVRAVMLVGKKAERARPFIEARGLPVLSSWHPSPINRGAAREKWAAIPEQWAQVMRFLH